MFARIPRVPGCFGIIRAMDNADHCVADARTRGAAAGTVLVTGGTVRLGLAVSARLRACGWRVLTSSHRPDAGADIVADLAVPLGAARLYSAACELLGGRPPDALVNNAALFSGDEALLEAVNHAAPCKLTMMMAGREEGRGAVVNVLDCRVLSGDGALMESAYARTKRRLLEYTLSSAAMFADTLRVNAVAPGPVMPPVAAGEPAGETPLGRPSADDVADAVAFLLAAGSTSGCVIPVDGGQHLLHTA